MFLLTAETKTLIDKLPASSLSECTLLIITVILDKLTAQSDQKRSQLMIKITSGVKIDLSIHCKTFKSIMYFNM